MFTSKTRPMWYYCIRLHALKPMHGQAGQHPRARFTMAEDRPRLIPSARVGHRRSNEGTPMQREFGRRLNFIENMYVNNSDSSNAMWVLVVESKVKISFDILRGATLLLSRRYPLLRSKVTRKLDSTGKKDSYFYREIEKEENLVDIRVVDDVDWQETQVTDGEILYDTENGPLWRVWLLKSVEITPEESETGHPFRTNIVFGYHHAIMDGNTGMKLIDQLLTYLEMIQDGSAGRIEVESLPLMPSQYDKLPAWLIPRYMQCPLWRKSKLVTRALKEMFNFKNLYIKHHSSEIAKNSNIAKQAKILPVVIPRSVTSKILTLSKQNGISVHGAITAASAVAMVRLVFGDNIPAKITIPTLLYVNMDRYLPSNAGDNHAGAFFIAVEMPIKVPKVNNCEDFWNLAKMCHQHVHQMLDGDALSVAKMCKYLYDTLGLDPIRMVKNNDKTPDGRCRALFALSNLGRCDFVTRESGRAFELVGSYACTAGKFGPIFSCYILTLRGKIHLSMVYYTHITSQARAHEYANLLVGALQDGLP
ncbi:uncharacterized protein [Ptychodera flava]|uniref:uncharacterized protein n=1 Tax=Ptychodera flava TaxID=63121 RepID=UPI003969F95C